MKYLKLINNERKNKQIMSAKGTVNCRYDDNIACAEVAALDFCKYSDSAGCLGENSYDVCISVLDDIGSCDEPNQVDVIGYN